LNAPGTLCLFLFQAEDGIRDRNVTGVQTCALPIFLPRSPGIPGVGFPADVLRLPSCAGSGHRPSHAVDAGTVGRSHRPGMPSPTHADGRSAVLGTGRHGPARSDQAVGTTRPGAVLRAASNRAWTSAQFTMFQTAST